MSFECPQMLRICLTTAMVAMTLTAPLIAGAATYNTGAAGTNNNDTGNAGAQPSTNRNWTTENKYWRDNFVSRPYYKNNMDYSQYEPAYRYGTDLYAKYPNKRYDELDQKTLRSDWERMNGADLSWDRANLAARDAYEHMYRYRTSDAGSSNR